MLSVRLYVVMTGVGIGLSQPQAGQLKTFRCGNRDLSSKMRTKFGPILELLRIQSRYFHQNATTF